MRLVSALLLTAFAFVLSGLTGGGSALALTHTVQPSLADPLVRKVVFSCGMTDEGFKCQTESGSVRHGKMRPIPGSPSNDSSSAPAENPSGDSDALPEAPRNWGTGTQAPSAVPATCPANSELLGGHCIPFTQRCTNAIPPSAYPPQCRGEEKQVCNFHPDGSKDCCCRTYSKY